MGKSCMGHESFIKKTLDSITELDASAMESAQKRLDGLTKPVGSLGMLEEIVKRLAGITGHMFPDVQRKMVVIMCADNGVVDEGVSQAPKIVTSLMTHSFMKGIAGINALSRHSGSEILVVDIGVDDEIRNKGILDRKIMRGTRNMTKGPAMTRDEALRAICAGIGVMADLKNKGYQLVATGEMGIGNTTTSSAIAAVFTGKPVEYLVGKGVGSTPGGLENKIATIQKAISLNEPDPGDPVDVLAKVGGLDLAGLAGCFIGAAAYRLPIVIDGFISSAAALAAIRMNPDVREFVFASHCSAEPGSGLIMEAISIRPALNLGMRLGEGTGAALMFHIIDAAVAAYKEMGTFSDAEINDYVPIE